MRQWNTIVWNEYTVDERKREDILKEIKKLSASYTPRWRFTEEDPDMGSVLALVYADQMEENIRRYNTILERDYVELVNMMGLSLKPAYPAHSIVQMGLVSDTVSGWKLPRGVKLLTESEGESAGLIFETTHTVYITEAKIKSVFMASGKSGKVIPIAGNFPPVEYLPGQRTEEESGEESSMSDALGYPFSLFDFSAKGYGRTGVLVYHPYLFDVEDNDIRVHLKGCDMADGLISGRYRMFYRAEGEFVPVSCIRREREDSIVFQKSLPCDKTEENSVLLFEPVGEIEENVYVEEIGLSSSGKHCCPDLIYNGSNELDVDRFLPFGEVISLYSELYIGHETYFSKPGARITIRFVLDFDRHMVTLPKEREEEELKVIKKKPKKDALGTPAEIYVNQVSIEYYNGTGWRRLGVHTALEGMLAGGRSGECTMTFVCPADWQPLETGGMDIRCIRIQVLGADNCYYQPAIHHYPVMRKMQVCYTYGDELEAPAKIVSVQGSFRQETGKWATKEKKIPFFVKNLYNSTGLYVGFDKKMEDGPVSLMFSIEEQESYEMGNLTFSYSTRDGFSRLKLVDHTDSLRHTGIVLFLPPSDMAKRTMEGQEAYWIRITDEKNVWEDKGIKGPVVRLISPNAVEVDNVDTLEMEDYYMDAFEPDMEFRLNAQHILSVDVWVNEMGQHAMADMKRMLREYPGETMAEYDYLGEITEFYVKWQEVDNFDGSQKDDRHYLVDRMNGQLRFGDGVHVRIPRNVNGIAFKVRTRRCNGKEGNVPAGRINQSLQGLVFLEGISNPVQAYGGVDMETMDEALHRGTSLLNGRERLITVVDYERAVLNFSRHIDQVKAVTGRRKDGVEDYDAVSLVVLMDDYKKGSFSFIHLCRRLREYLLERCDLSIDPQKLYIVEPVFVQVSVEAWVRVIHQDDTFEVQQALTEMLEEYLDPVSGNGWEIGRMVRKEQIELQMNMEKGRAMLHKILVTAGYWDEKGYHEQDLGSFLANPFVVVTSGSHRIHFEE